ncbi:MAG TPA: VOC family protein [Candidatus Udaeobacter sp.]|jgi:predicted enzyme related to lactoylglutathione lyase|nr:VOC family protein [Candidatus Udaeobacter sp.]
MKVKNIAFVGIPVTDMAEARAFYEGVLGLKPDPEMTGEKWTEYPVGTGVIAIANVGSDWQPSDQGTAAALEVESLEGAIAQLKEHKIRYDEVESPVCRMAIIQDPNGNKLIIHKLKSENEKGICK